MPASAAVPQSASRSQPSGLLSAAGSLDRLLERCETGLQGITACFQPLDGHTSQLLQLTRTLVTLAEEVGPRSILPLVQATYAQAQDLVGQRIAASRAALELLHHEPALLNRLAGIFRPQENIARASKVIAVMLRVESARLGPSGEGFTFMSGELEAAADSISDESGEVHRLVAASRLSAADRLRGAQQALDATSTSLAGMAESAESARPHVEDLAYGFSAAPAAVNHAVAACSANIARVICAVQSQDLTRQQTEHVRDLLRFCAGDHARFPDLHPHHIPTLLRLQRRQLETIQTSARSWIDEIDRCVAAVEDLGREEIESLLHSVEDLRTAVAGQNRWIEDFQAQCDHCDALGGPGMHDFSRILHSVRLRLEQSQKTSERMQLLNLNSMVAAHNRGYQAAAILELTHSISRLADEWRDLTRASSEIMDGPLAAATGQQETMRRIADSTREVITGLRAQSGSSVSSLAEAARLARDTEAASHNLRRETRDLVSRIRDGANALRAFVSGLDKITQTIADALPEHPELPLATDDLHTAERVVGNLYTSQIERRILRAHLFGEDAAFTLEPESEPAESEIELF